MPRRGKDAEHAFQVESKPLNRRPTMSNIEAHTTTARYARCIAASKRIRWDIDEDVIRGRTLDVADNYLPEGLSLVDGLAF
jgi:hypothetical protein